MAIAFHPLVLILGAGEQRWGLVEDLRQIKAWPEKIGDHSNFSERNVMKSMQLRKVRFAVRRQCLAAAALGISLLVSHDSAAMAETYAIDFVTAVGGASILGDDGEIIGLERLRGFCPAPYPSCYGKDRVVVWPAQGGNPVPLPAPSGLPFLSPAGMNKLGWIAGTASSFSVDFKPQAVVWKPDGVGYSVQELGLLPGNTIARVAGIDNFNRVVGYNTITNILAPDAAPFQWSPSGGLTNLTLSGFPNDIPLDISPKGTVALNSFWYRLDAPGVVTPNATLPAGFVAAEAVARINDAGDQARFLLTSGSSSIAYLHRYIARTGRWQLIAGAGTGRLSSYGLGSIDKARNITWTVLSAGVFAAGPNDLAQPLTLLLSPAYVGAQVSAAGPRNAAGVIAANVMIGRSAGRLVKLVPVNACIAACVRVAELQMTAQKIQNCKSTNVVSAKLKVIDETGTPLSGVTVKGRFLDDYYLNEKVSGITDSDGRVRFIHRGPACVGAVAFFVDDAKITSRSFDRTQGVLTNFVIPVP